MERDKIGWKLCRKLNKKNWYKYSAVLVKLKILGEVRFDPGMNNGKRRTDKAKVLAIYDAPFSDHGIMRKKGKKLSKSYRAVSDYNRSFGYKQGQIKTPAWFGGDGLECSGGIYFFWSKANALDYF